MAETQTSDRRLIEEMVSQGVLRRILVVQDLGPVNEGDHIIVVANVAVAVDTSRRPDPVVVKLKPVPTADVPKRAYKKRTVSEPQPSSLEVNRASILNIIREFQPIASLQISDKLGLARNDSIKRHRVTDIIKSLRNKNEIQRYPDDRLGQFRYQIAQKVDASV